MKQNLTCVTVVDPMGVSHLHSDLTLIHKDKGNSHGWLQHLIYLVYLKDRWMLFTWVGLVVSTWDLRVYSS